MDPAKAFEAQLKNAVNVFALDYPAEAYYVMIMANEFSTGILKDLLFELEVEQSEEEQLIFIQFKKSSTGKDAVDKIDIDCTFKDKYLKHDQANIMCYKKM